MMVKACRERRNKNVNWKISRRNNHLRIGVGFSWKNDEVISNIYSIIIIVFFACYKNVYSVEFVPRRENLEIVMKLTT